MAKVDKLNSPYAETVALPEGKKCYLLNGSPGDCAAGLLCARIPDPDNPTHRGVDGVCKKGNIYAQGTTAKLMEI